MLAAAEDPQAHAEPGGAAGPAEGRHHHQHHHLVLPRPAALVRHAVPNLIEGKLIPVLLFVGLLELAGTTGALLAALAWSLASIGYRTATKRKVPGLVVVSALGLIARTIVALASGSLVVYFLQPTITTALVGIAFAVSVPLGRPLAERLANDFCPLDPQSASHPALRRFFLQFSLVWAAVSLANAAVTLWMLLTQSPTTFVVVKSFMGPTFTGAMLLAAVPWFRRSMRTAGVAVRFAEVPVGRRRLAPAQ
ncbi:MAG: VC0807 family protein [Acidimicrobiales bacterium]